MIFIPANSKYKKQQKGKAFNKIKSNISLCRLKFGTIGLRSMSFGRLDSKQLNSFKKSITKIIKKRGKFILNIFPQTPITKKPLAIRMGKGKGFVDHWVCKVKPGLMLCEINITPTSLGIKALDLAQIKLPFATRVIFN